MVERERETEIALAYLMVGLKACLKAVWRVDQMAGLKVAWRVDQMVV
jgi:hypothetical protein